MRLVSLFLNANLIKFSLTDGDLSAYYMDPRTNTMTRKIYSKFAKSLSFLKRWVAVFSYFKWELKSFFNSINHGAEIRKMKHSTQKTSSKNHVHYICCWLLRFSKTFGSFLQIISLLGTTVLHHISSKKSKLLTKFCVNKTVTLSND